MNICCKQRANSTHSVFCSLKNAMRPYSAMGPRQRIERLLNFNKRLNSAPDSVRALREWELNLEQSLVKIPGRVVDRQQINFGGGYT